MMHFYKEAAKLKNYFMDEPLKSHETFYKQIAMNNNCHK